MKRSRAEGCLQVVDQVEDEIEATVTRCSGDDDGFVQTGDGSKWVAGRVCERGEDAGLGVNEAPAGEQGPCAGHGLVGERGYVVQPLCRSK